MAWEGFFAYGGTEIINAARTEAYAAHGNVGWFKPVYNQPDLAWLLGDPRYNTPLQDDAPWTDPDNLDSYDFLGVYPLEVTGIEDSTVSATVTESVIDGGYIGRTRKGTRAVVFSAVLVGLSSCAVEYGLRWLRNVLNGSPCFGASYGVCGGADLCYLGCVPLIGEPEVTYSPGPIVLNDTNLATNPNVEVGGAGGWYSNDPVKYVMSATAAQPIGGSQSVLSTRQGAQTVAATNQAVNPSLAGGALTGWNSNSGTLYPATLDTSGAMSGLNSVVTTRTAATPSATAGSIYLVPGTLLTQGFACTPGVPITFSIDVKTEQAERYIQWYGTFLDSGGASLGTTTVTYLRHTVANQTYRAVSTVVPPANTASIRLLVTVNAESGNAVTGERVWYDNLRVSTGAATADAVNLFINPNCGDRTHPAGTVSNWYSTNSALFAVTLDTTSQMTGQYSALSTRTGTLSKYASTIYLLGAGAGSGMPVTVGQTYTGSADIKVEQPNRQARVYFSWFDSAGAYIGDGVRPAYAPVQPGVVVRMSATDVPPAGVATTRLVLDVTTVDGSNAVAGERVWFDSGLVIAGTSTTPFAGSSQPDGTYVYSWIGSASSSASQRWRVTDSQQTDYTYFDGSTPAASPLSYRWTGAANASTSERVLTSAPSDGVVASTYYQATASTPFACTPGVPITFAIDVKVENTNRQINGYFSWFNDGISTTVTIPAGTPGSVARFVMTATPPAGVTTVYPVVNVQSTSGNALSGEQVWFDNLYVGSDSSGNYFDGSNPTQGDYSYSWTGAVNASTSQRFIQTYVPDPLPTAEDCYDKVGRSLHGVTTTVGPNVTKKMDLIDGSAAWTVTWTMVAANPAEFGVERPLVVGFLDPLVDIPYYGGVVPDGGDFDDDGFVQTEQKCPVPVFTPVFDPTCGLLVPPPDVPTIVPTCFSFPVNYTRRSFTIPREKIPLWTEVVPVLKVTTKQTEARNVRIRFYADTFNTGNPSNDPCNYCGDLVISYVPPSATLVLDGMDQSVYIDQPGQGRRRADAVVSDSTGNPFEWPQFSCGFGYVVTVDTPQQTTKLPVIDLSLVPRVI